MGKLLPVLFVIVAGCASRTPGRVAGGALTVAGTAITASFASRHCPPTLPGSEFVSCGLAKTEGLGVGVLVLAVGVTTLIVNESVGRRLPAHEPATAPPAEVTSDVTSDDAAPELHQLVVNASVAARAGRCKAVEAIAERIEQLDFTFRHDGFLRDPAIAACVD